MSFILKDKTWTIVGKASWLIVWSIPCLAIAVNKGVLVGVPVFIIPIAILKILSGVSSLNKRWHGVFDPMSDELLESRKIIYTKKLIRWAIMLLTSLIILYFNYKP